MQAAQATQQQVETVVEAVEQTSLAQQVEAIANLPVKEGWTVERIREMILDAYRQQREYVRPVYQSWGYEQFGTGCAMTVLARALGGQSDSGISIIGRVIDKTGMPPSIAHAVPHGFDEWSRDESHPTIQFRRRGAVIGWEPSIGYLAGYEAGRAIFKDGVLGEKYIVKHG